jgi:hypothetical protein
MAKRSLLSRCSSYICDIFTLLFALQREDLQVLCAVFMMISILFLFAIGSYRMTHKITFKRSAVILWFVLNQININNLHVVYSCLQEK